MQHREHFLSVFLVFFFLSLAFWGLSTLGILNGTRSFLEKIVSPIEKTRYDLFQKIPLFLEDARIKKLSLENIDLRKKISDEKRLMGENVALLDQFKTITPSSYNLMPAQIIGTPGFMPGVFTPTTFVINKGKKDGMKVGLAVVFKDNLVGKITKTSFYLSQVDLIINSSSSFAAKNQNGVLGVIKGDGEKMILDNVILSQTLNISDTVLTYGDLDVNGTGYPAGLIIGKIISVNKSPSALFQKAEVRSILDFVTLTTVFVIMQP